MHPNARQTCESSNLPTCFNVTATERFAGCDRHRLFRRLRLHVVLTFLLVELTLFLSRRVLVLLVLGPRNISHHSTTLILHFVVGGGGYYRLKTAGVRKNSEAKERGHKVIHIRLRLGELHLILVLDFRLPCIPHRARKNVSARDHVFLFSPNHKYLSSLPPVGDKLQDTSYICHASERYPPSKLRRNELERSSSRAPSETSCMFW